MTMVDPTFFEKNRRWIIYGVLALVVLAGIAFLVSKVSDWRFNRDVSKRKAAIANQVQEIANAQSEAANLKAKLPDAVANVARDTQALLDDQNASTEARNATNQALANLANAVNANRSVDVSAIDLQRKLQELDQ